MAENILIHIESYIGANVKTVWDMYTSPDHIVKWNAASDDWHTTKSENDLVTGGRFLSRMEAKDGSFGFDFSGVYDVVEEFKRIAYTLDDHRKVVVNFSESDGKTLVVVEFEAEGENSLELQEAGWLAILTNFKKYVEEN